MLGTEKGIETGAAGSYEYIRYYGTTFPLRYKPSDPAGHQLLTDDDCPTKAGLTRTLQDGTDTLVSGQYTGSFSTEGGAVFQTMS
jgi:hypothetical protein